MTMNIAGLSQTLSDETITWRGFGEPVMLNFSKLSGESLTPESGVLEPMVKLLQGLHEQQKNINLIREQEGKAPINVITRTAEVSASGNPLYHYTMSIEIDLEASLNNVIDPLA